MNIRTSNIKQADRFETHRLIINILLDHSWFAKHTHKTKHGAKINTSMIKRKHRRTGLIWFVVFMSGLEYEVNLAN
jgi:hypothetical protein